MMNNYVLDTGEYLGIDSYYFENNKLKFKLIYENKIYKPVTTVVTVNTDWNILWPAYCPLHKPPYNKNINVLYTFDDMILSYKDILEREYPEYFNSNSVVGNKQAKIKRLKRTIK